MLPTFDSVEERQRHATADETETSQDGQTKSLWLHCSIGPELEEGEEEDDSKTQVSKPSSADDDAS